MNLQLPPELKDLDINFITILFGIYIITVGIAYYFIYHKHHKKNKIELDELISLVAKFYVTTTITIIAILVGIVCIIFANEFKDNRADVIFRVLMGIVIITVAIINFVFYIKGSLKDLNQEIRAQNRKATIKIGEVLELIFFIIFITMPIWRIPKFIELVEDKKQLTIEIIRAFGLCIATLFLLDSINPIDIKGKIKKLFIKKETKLK